MVSEQAQDTLATVGRWLTMLEEHVLVLLQQSQPESLKPGECEQAIARHMALLERFLKLYRVIGQATEANDELEQLRALMYGEGELDSSDATDES